MMLRLALLTYTVLLTATTGVSAQCSVCGDGKKVSAPDEIFAYPGQQVVTCGTLEAAGAAGGLITDAQCVILVDLVQAPCSCVPDGTAIAATPAPVAANAAPVSPAPTLNGCSICGDGMTVTLPNAIFTWPGEPVVPCGTLEGAGFAGNIPLNQCSVLPKVLSDDCGCAPAGTQPVTVPTSAPREQPFIPPAQLFAASGVTVQDKSNLAPGAIAGIVIGTLVGAFLLVLLVVKMVVRSNGANKSIEMAERNRSAPPPTTFEVSSAGSNVDSSAENSML